MIDAGDRVVVLALLLGRGTGSGIEIELRAGYIWTWRGGMAVRLEAFKDHKTALEASGRHVITLKPVCRLQPDRESGALRVAGLLTDDHQKALPSPACLPTRKGTAGRPEGPASSRPAGFCSTEAKET
jgi:hypothetical protein